jgi:hypothetical protein
MPKEDKIGFIFVNAGSNIIGDGGCEHLSKAFWPLLESIDLGYSKISSKGCEHISSAKWPLL